MSQKWEKGSMALKRRPASIFTSRPGTSRAFRQPGSPPAFPTRRFIRSNLYPIMLPPGRSGPSRRWTSCKMIPISERSCSKRVVASTKALFGLGHDFLYLRDHPLHHPFDARLKGDHRGGAAGTGALQHQVDSPFMIALELDSAAVHFDGRLDIILEQFLYPLDDVVVIRIDMVALRFDKDDLLFVDHRLVFLEIFLQELPDRRNHVVPIRVRGLGERYKIAGDEHTLDKGKAKQLGGERGWPGSFRVGEIDAFSGIQ